jgi:ubiquinone/menaquinone biosynthesis C-methylase UbiE
MSTAALPDAPVIDEELDLLESLVPLAGQRVIELGCGNARLVRLLLDRHPDASVTGLEVDERQHAMNLAAPRERLRFAAAGAQAVPFPDGSFDVAVMLKSLHHVPMPLMAQALDEVARVLRPQGYLYVSEPEYRGALNDLVRLYNDEREVRAAAQAALDAALRTGRWIAVAERRFVQPASFRSFEDFETRMMRPTFADHGLTDALVARVRAAFEPHCGPDGAHFVRPLHVRLLRRRD